MLRKGLFILWVVCQGILTLDAILWVTGQLDASISSTGNVNYYGTPQITQHGSSTGKAVPMGNK